MANENLNTQNTEVKTEPKIAKYRKAGWIATAILGVLMIAMLIAYIATGGTYGLDQGTAETAVAAIKAVSGYGIC